jgi:serine protease Do
MRRAPWLAAALLLPTTMFFLAGAAARAQDGLDDEYSAASRKELLDQLAQEASLLERQSNVLKKVVKLVGPTVVHIDADKSLYGRRSDVEEAGSGFVVKFGDRPYVITNRHVIKNATLGDIRIRLTDGRVLNPTKVWSDPETDIAVMSVADTRLPTSQLADSNLVEIGDFVLAIGSPFGLSHSVTFGIISAKGRRDLKLGDEVHFQDFLQTDAAINPGNSGGPLINLRGEVVGMNTAIASSSGGSEGIGFTIPINIVMVVARQLVERGSVVRAFMGVALDRKFSPAMATSVGLRRSRGAHITRVTPGSPAEAAKLQAGDVVLRYDGVPVEDDLHLINMVSLTEVGRSVPLSVFRDQKVLSLTVKVGAAPPKPPAANSAPAKQ